MSRSRTPRDLSHLQAIIHALTRGDAMQAFRTEINFAIKICGTRKKFLRIIPAAVSNRKRRISHDNTIANRERS